jgi:hypothetical protein
MLAYRMKFKLLNMANKSALVWDPSRLENAFVEEVRFIE